jgi:cellulose synthase/poly-beta-1,6-N-acetylglucosamine synthase-like glycosyltransferase
MITFDPNLALYYFGIFFSLFIGVFYFITLFENRTRLKDPKVGKLHEVSIIVPAFNEAKTIGDTIISLKNLNYPAAKVRIIVVDDGSSDGTYEVACQFSGIQVIKKENGGKASAINVGLREAKTELVAVMDADSFVSEHALWSMIGYFKHEKTMAVTPALKVHNPQGFWQGVQYVEYLFSVFFRKMFSFLNGVYVTPGPFSIYRKEFFDKHGGFQEDNMSEDLEVALRIQLHDYKIENSINAEVFTVAPNNFPALLKQRIRWYTGVLNNLYTYRELFTTKKGYLGIFVLPVTLISIALVLVFFGYYGVLLVSGLIRNISQFQLINFDIFRPIQNFWSNFSLMEHVNPMSVLLFIMIAFTLVIFMLSRLYSRDKGKVTGSFIMYALVYGPIFGVMWVTTVTHRLLNLKIRW